MRRAARGATIVLAYACLAFGFLVGAIGSGILTAGMRLLDYAYRAERGGPVRWFDGLNGRRP